MTDIRRETCIIIRKHGLFLQGRSVMTNELVWTWSAYDAWRTRNRALAVDVARETGGVMVLFNPIVNQKRVI